MKISSDFALLDVKAGRHKLAKQFDGFRTAEREDRIPVTITGFISNRWGNDDGTSIEFGVDVTDVAIKPRGEPMAKAATKTKAKAAPPAKPVKKPAARKR